MRKCSPVFPFSIHSLPITPKITQQGHNGANDLILWRPISQRKMEYSHFIFMWFLSFWRTLSECRGFVLFCWVLMVNLMHAKYTWRIHYFKRFCIIIKIGHIMHSYTWLFFLVCFILFCWHRTLLWSPDWPGMWYSVQPRLALNSIS